MSAERVLVVALAIVSTLAAGLAIDGRTRAPVGGRALLLVTAANVLALPLLAYGLVRGLAVDGGAGLILAAAAPGGSTGPLLAVLGRGDAATAALVFVVTTTAGAVAALIATLALDVAGVGAVLGAALVVLLGSVGPLAAGLLLRARRPALALAWQPWLARLGLVLLLATIAVLAARHGGAARLTDVVIGAVITLAALAIGLVVPGGAGRVAVAQVSAVRNLTLALLVLAVVGAPPAQTMAVLAYGLAMYVVTLLAAVGWRAAMKAA